MHMYMHILMHMHMHMHMHAKADLLGRAPQSRPNHAPITGTCTCRHAHARYLLGREFGEADGAEDGAGGGRVEEQSDRHGEARVQQDHLCAVGSGQLAVGSGQWAVGSGQWAATGT